MTTSTWNLDTTISEWQTYVAPVAVSSTATNPSSGIPSVPIKTNNVPPDVWWGSTPANKKTTAKSDSLDATLKTDITNTYTDTKTQNDKVLADRKQAEEEAAASTIANLEAERLQKESAAIEEDARQKARAEEDARMQQEVDARYREKQQAELASLKAKQADEERKLAIDNDVAQQASAVAFWKLWLSLSTAWITTAQQIFTTWAYNLAKLKTENAYQYADLQEQVAKTEFEHTNAVNKIIRDSEDKSYTIRKTLNEEVYRIKNSIIKTTLDKKKAIATATEAYLKARNDNEKETLKKMQDRADLVKKENDAIYDVLKKKEEYASTHITTLVDSGRWALLPDSEKVRLEKLAWVPFWTTDMKNKALIWKNLYEQIQAVTWLKGVTLSVSDYTKITQEASFYMANWRGMEDAMNMAINAHISKSPEMQAKIRELQKKWRTGWWGSSVASTWKYKETVNYVNPKTNDIVAVDVDSNGKKTVNGQTFNLSWYVEAGASKVDADAALYNEITAAMSGGTTE